MPFYLNTAFGFVTEQTIKQARSHRPHAPACHPDMRRAHPFPSFDAADDFAKALVENINWPRSGRYYAVVNPADSVYPTSK